MQCNKYPVTQSYQRDILQYELVTIASIRTNNGCAPSLYPDVFLHLMRVRKTWFMMQVQGETISLSKPSFHLCPMPKFSHALICVKQLFGIVPLLSVLHVLNLQIWSSLAMEIRALMILTKPPRMGSVLPRTYSAMCKPTGHAILWVRRMFTTQRLLPDIYINAILTFFASCMTF